MSGATDTLGQGGAAETGHARQMDAIYGLQRHVYDLTRKYYLLGRDRLIAELDVPEGGHVLEIGCGTARNMALAAKAWPDARLYGLDISAEMLKSARKNMQRHGFATQSSLALADATDFDPAALFGRNGFDRIFASYTLSMIPGWEKALDLCCGLLLPGGELHVVDFGQQEGLPGWFSRGLKAWLARFHVAPRPDLFGVGEALAAHHGLSFAGNRLYRDYARAMVLRRI